MKSVFYVASGIISALKSNQARNSMAKVVAAFFLGMAFMTFSGCGGGESAPPEPASGQMPIKSATPVVTDYTKFQVAVPINLGGWFWSSPTVQDESILPIAGKSSYTLLRDALNIITVRNRQTGQVYVPGSDYSLANGKLLIPVGSQIPVVPSDWTSTPQAGATNTPVRADGSAIRVSDDYQFHQIAVTYDAAPYPGSFLGSAGAQKFLAKLNAENKVAVTFIGDSITYGSTSTWELNANPHQHGYAELVASHLAALYPGQIYFRNKALAGSTAGWGAYVAASALGDTPSDLVVIAFGMNDSGLRTSQDSFTSSLRTMIAAARSINPDAEIVLVSSWPSNPELSPQNWDCFTWYYAAISQVANDTPDVLVANMTSPTWDYILTRKTMYDMSSNGMNHPSDWMATIYAQVVLKSILGI